MFFVVQLLCLVSMLSSATAPLVPLVHRQAIGGFMIWGMIMEEWPGSEHV